MLTKKQILPLAKELLSAVDYETRPIRLIGLSVSNPFSQDGKKQVAVQLSLDFPE